MVLLPIAQEYGAEAVNPEPEGAIENPLRPSNDIDVLLGVVPELVAWTHSLDVERKRLPCREQFVSSLELRGCLVIIYGVY